METTKIVANIKASVVWLAVISQWCERTARCSRQQPATPVAGIARIAWRLQYYWSSLRYWSALSNRNLARCWHSCFRSLTRRRLQHRPSCVTAYSCDNLSVNHGGVAIVADAHIVLSTLPSSRPHLRSSVHVPVSAVSLQSLSCCTGQTCIRSSSSRRSLTNLRPCWSALNLTLRLCIILYRTVSQNFVWYHIVSYRFPLGPYRANTNNILTYLLSYTVSEI